MPISKKPGLLYTAIALLTAITFLWSQCIWAIGLETLYNHPSDNLQRHFAAKNLKSEVNLPQNLHRNCLKLFCRFLAIGIKKFNFEDKFAYVGTENPIQTCVIPSDNDRLGRIDEKYGKIDGESYNYKATAYDSFGRPIRWEEEIGDVDYEHTDVIYNEIGDIAYEKVFTSAETFFTESESVNEYWYGYNEHGMLEKTKENEIYSDTSRTFWGKLFDVIIYGPLALLPDDIFFEYVKPAMDAIVGFLNPLYIPVIIGLDFIRNIASGMNPGDALKGAAIQLAVWAISAGLSGGAPPPIEGLLKSGGDALTRAIVTQAVKTVVTRAVYNLLEDKLGTFGAALASALAGALVTTFSALPQFKEIDGKIVVDLLSSDFGLLTATGALDIWKIVGVVAQAGVTALLKEIIKRNPDLAWAEPLLETLLSTAVSKVINNIRQAIIAQKIKQLEQKGYNVITDPYGNVTLLTKIDQENGIICYYSPDEKLQYSDQTIQKDGEEYIIRTYGLGNSEIYIRDKQAGSYNLLFKGEGWFNSVETYQNKEGTAIQFISLTSPDGKTTYFELDGRPILTSLPDGRIISYHYNGQIEGILAKDALPSWDNYGKFNGSYIEGNKGITYYDNEGNYTGFTPDGFTAVKAGDKVAYSYAEVSPNSFYMVDSDGNNQKLVTQQLDSNYIPVGEYISDDKTIEYYDSRGIKIWDRENQLNSVINLYLEDGTVWANITTIVSKSGLIEGYRFTEIATGDFRQYNEKGELQAYYLARKDAQGSIIRYKGVDINGTQITLRRDGTIHSTLTKGPKGYIYTAYDPRDPSKVYYRIGPDTVYLVKTNGEVRFSIGYDPEKDKYILYDKLLTKITDDPLVVFAKLNFTLSTLPRSIQSKIIINVMYYIGDVLNYVMIEEENRLIADQIIKDIENQSGNAFIRFGDSILYNLERMDLGLINSSYGYGEDIHYYNTYFLARVAGLNHNDAHYIASTAQYVDNNDTTNAITSGDENRRIFHFFAQGDDPTQRNNTILSLIIDHFVQTGDITGFSIALHPMADTYSHETFNAYRDSAVNRRTGLQSPFRDDIGHWDAPDGGHEPDYPYLDTNKAVEASKVVFEKLSEFSKQRGNTVKYTFADIEQLIRGPLSTVSPDNEVRIHAWQVFIYNFDFDKDAVRDGQIAMYDESEYKHRDDLYFEQSANVYRETVADEEARHLLAYNTFQKDIVLDDNFNTYVYEYNQINLQIPQINSINYGLSYDLYFDQNTNSLIDMNLEQ